MDNECQEMCCRHPKEREATMQTFIVSILSKEDARKQLNQMLAEEKRTVYIKSFKVSDPHDHIKKLRNEHRDFAKTRILQGEIEPLSPELEDTTEQATDTIDNIEPLNGYDNTIYEQGQRDGITDLVRTNEHQS